MRFTPYLRSTMTEERLHGMALMYAHKDIKVYVEEYVYLFEWNNIQTWSLDYHEQEKCQQPIHFNIVFKKCDNIYYYWFIVHFLIELDFLFITFRLHFLLSWMSSMSISSSAIYASTFSNHVVVYPLPWALLVGGVRCCRLWSTSQLLRPSGQQCSHSGGVCPQIQGVCVVCVDVTEGA